MLNPATTAPNPAATCHLYSKGSENRANISLPGSAVTVVRTGRALQVLPSIFSTNSAAVRVELVVVLTISGASIMTTSVTVFVAVIVVVAIAVVVIVSLTVWVRVSVTVLVVNVMSDDEAGRSVLDIARSPG